MKPTQLIFLHPNVMRLKNTFIIDFQGVKKQKYSGGLRNAYIFLLCAILKNLAKNKIQKNLNIENSEKTY
jgi:hypothetical protein